MNFNLKPHPFLAHFIPGCFTAIIVVMAHYGWSMTELNRTMGNMTNHAMLAAVVGILILGECIDAARDVLEEPLDKWCGKINWPKVLNPDKTEDRLYVFENYYFTYYVFCANSFLAVVVAFVGCQIDRLLPTLTYKALTVLVLMALTFFLDARSLRGELVKHSQIKTKSNNAE